VAVVACGFTTDDIQQSTTVKIMAASLIGQTQQILHGLNRGSMKVSGTCKSSTITTGANEQSKFFFPVDLNSATGEFLATGSNELLDTSIAVAALGTADMAAALADWDISNKAVDFDEKFHVKKFRGQNPDDRRRRNFRDVKDAVEAKLQADLPFGQSITIGDIVDGSKVAGSGAQLLIKDFRVSWFAQEDGTADGVAAIDVSVVEKYVANVLFAFGMEAQEYALKVEEYAWLTTSTTTVSTTTVTTITTATTKPAEASGIPGYVIHVKPGFLIKPSGEEGAIVCRTAASPCPDDDKVKTVESMADAAKEIFDIEAAFTQKAIANADDTIKNLRDDFATKAATYKTMKNALDACDQKEVDKLGTISYPNKCADEQKAFGSASVDFIAFVAGTGIGLDFNAQITKIMSEKGYAMSSLSKLQADYKDTLVDIITYDDVAHGTEDTFGYKVPEEVKDIQTSFQLVVDELAALNLAVQETQRGLSAASKDSRSNAVAEKSELERAEATLKSAVQNCQDTENRRLADVPASVLTVGSKIYKEEVELKEDTIEATCRPYVEELGIVGEQIASTDAKYDALQKATDEAFDETSTVIDELDEFEKTGKAEILASISERVTGDDAFPLLYIIIGGAGLLILILLIALVVSSSGNSTPKQGSNQNWDNAGAGSSVAFENPVYAGEEGEEEGNYAEEGADEAGGLYDEPEQFANPGAEDGAGGGYLDVEPDDDEDDDESEEGESEEDDGEDGEEAGDDDDDEGDEEEDDDEEADEEAEEEDDDDDDDDDDEDDDEDESEEDDDDE